MTIQEAAAVLKVQLPVSLNSLKTAFRRLSREEHPDISKHPKAAERFQAVKTSYEFLKTSKDALEYSAEDAKVLRCEDGTHLSELGQGLGPLTNGRPCDECSGKGYLSYRTSKVLCSDCRDAFSFDPSAPFEYRCRKCKGSGKFQDKGQCFACRGSGWHRPKGRRNICTSCRGTSFVDNPHGAVSYEKCLTCKGCGELMVFNPVLPKGLLGR
jgi:DnaJ-class molecular chaperone